MLICFDFDFSLIVCACVCLWLKLLSRIINLSGIRCSSMSVLIKSFQNLFMFLRLKRCFALTWEFSWPSVHMSVSVYICLIRLAGIFEDWYRFSPYILASRSKAFWGRRSAVGSASDSWSVDTCLSWVRAPSKTSVVSLSKKLLSLLSTGWFQDLQKHENCLFHNRTKID